MTDPDLDPDRAPRAAPDDAELARLEAAVALALGGAPDAAPGDAGAAALAAYGDPRPSAATPARPSFRASLRASFVSGRFEGDGAPPAVVSRALDAEPPPAPDPEFRAALRARFLAAPTHAVPVAPVTLLRLTGAPDEAGRGARPAGGARRSVTHGQDAAPTAHERGARSWPRAGLAAVVAAALLAAVLLRGQLGWPGARSDAEGPARWTLFGAGQLAGLLVDGVAVTDGAALEVRLGAGGNIETGAHGLRLAVGREVVIDIGPGPRARVPEYTVGGGLTFELERGALRVATGPDFQPAGGGRRLAIVTPHLEALAVGTVFGVDCADDHSCVCCLEGVALAHSLLAGSDGEGRIEAGRARVVFADGRLLDLELVPDHRAPLAALRHAWPA